MDFVVSPAVLIPRPETEFLLDHLIKQVTTSHTHLVRALDLCTGSGVIAVILQKELGCSQVVGADISPEALLLAQENVTRLCDSGTVDLIASDIFSAFTPQPTFDLIVSNPPYIATSDIAGLDEEVQQEPVLALDGGPDGLVIIEEIVAHAREYLQPGGWLFLEIGSDQGRTVFEIMTGAGFADVAIVKDWSGRNRVAQARYFS